jgi:hypothetical protein
MRILPLTGSHDRQGFDCGRPELNDDHWLGGVTGQHQKKELSKTFVAVLGHAHRVICGYYALTPTDVDTGGLAEIQRKRLPRVTVRA